MTAAGASAYSEGVAAGVPLVFGTTDDASPDSVTDAAGNIHATFAVGGRLSYIYKPRGAAKWQPAIDLGVTSVTTPDIAADPAGNLFVIYSFSSDIFYINAPPAAGRGPRRRN